MTVITRASKDACKDKNYNCNFIRLKFAKLYYHSRVIKANFFDLLKSKKILNLLKIIENVILTSNDIIAGNGIILEVCIYNCDKQKAIINNHQKGFSKQVRKTFG